jgi:hypothetical protein
MRGIRQTISEGGGSCITDEVKWACSELNKDGVVLITVYINHDSDNCSSFVSKCVVVVCMHV